MGGLAGWLWLAGSGWLALAGWLWVANSLGFLFIENSVFNGGLW
jgi:hypothetical protein